MGKNMGVPLVSVILPFYNGKQERLEKAIDSVYVQTWDNFEFIIINDGSTDGVEQVIEKYVGKYNNIVYVKNNKNLGLITSLNIGIDKSNGKYIARIDADDFWISRDKLEKQVEFMEKNSDYGLCGAGEIVHVDENDGVLFTEFKNRLTDEQIRNHFLQQNQIIHSGVLLRKEALENVGNYDLRFALVEDYELWLRIGTKYKLANLESVSIAYRINYYNGVSLKNLQKQKNIAFKIFWLYRHKYPNFMNAFILRCGAYVLPKKIRKFIWRKLNPHLAVK